MAIYEMNGKAKYKKQSVTQTYSMGKGVYVTQSFVFSNLKTVLGITSISGSGQFGDVMPSMEISGNKVNMTLMSYAGAGYTTTLTLEAQGI